MDGRARTSTELAVVGGVSPSTASVHLARPKAARLVNVLVQGTLLPQPERRERRHGAGGFERPRGPAASRVWSRTPSRLRDARTCYDHMAGAVAVALHDCFLTLKWLTAASAGDNGCVLTGTGAKAFETLGIDVEATRTLRRRFAYARLDWSERRPHLGGALGAAFLTLALRKKWVAPDLTVGL